jgi:hypothetical protein
MMAHHPGYPYEYEYSREKDASGVYDINNPAAVDPLSKQVEVALPGKQFIVSCDYGACNICFKNNISSEEKTTLDTVVSDHKSA